MEQETTCFVGLPNTMKTNITSLATKMTVTRRNASIISSACERRLLVCLIKRKLVYFVNIVTARPTQTDWHSLRG